MLSNFILPTKIGSTIPYYRLIECCAIYTKLLEDAHAQMLQADNRDILDLINEQLSHTNWFLARLGTFGPVVKDFDSSCLPPPWHDCRSSKEIAEYNLAFWDVIKDRLDFPVEELFYKAPVTVVPDGKNQDM